MTKKEGGGRRKEDSGKGGQPTRIGTQVRFLACVRAIVLFHVAQLREGLSTACEITRYTADSVLNAG